jgi:ribonuclease III
LSDLADLQARLGVSFRNPDLLAQALVHGSYLNETALPGVVSNERLEFLGDAVLDLAVAVWLYREFPDAGEGELTRRRVRLVRGTTLAKVAAGIGLGEFLKLSRGEQTGGGRAKPRNLAGAFEAVIAALYLDQGFDACTDLIGRFIAPLAASEDAADAKTRLQEYLQARGRGRPEYKVTTAGGAAHAPAFEAVVSAGDSLLGQGRGGSKKAAETAAAAAALASLGEIDE